MKNLTESHRARNVIKTAAEKTRACGGVTGVGGGCGVVRACGSNSAPRSGVCASSVRACSKGNITSRARFLPKASVPFRSPNASCTQRWRASAAAAAAMPCATPTVPPAGIEVGEGRTLGSWADDVSNVSRRPLSCGSWREREGERQFKEENGEKAKVTGRQCTVANTFTSNNRQPGNAGGAYSREQSNSWVCGLSSGQATGARVQHLGRNRLLCWGERRERGAAESSASRKRVRLVGRLGIWFAESSGCGMHRKHKKIHTYPSTHRQPSNTCERGRARHLTGVACSSCSASAGGDATVASPVELPAAGETSCSSTRADDAAPGEDALAVLALAAAVWVRAEWGRGKREREAQPPHQEGVPAASPLPLLSSPCASLPTAHSLRPEGRSCQARGVSNIA